jgi:hypothetical protein
MTKPAHRYAVVTRYSPSFIRQTEC